MRVAKRSFVASNPQVATALLTPSVLCLFLSLHEGTESALTSQPKPVVSVTYYHVLRTEYYLSTWSEQYLAGVGRLLGSQTRTAVSIAMEKLLLDMQMTFVLSASVGPSHLCTTYSILRT